jgi:anti-sigma-K factor RskA
MEADTIHELTAAYALDALDEREEREYEAHLARCPQCREELASFTETATSLAYGVESPAPPPDLRDRILERARAERPNVVPLRQPAWRSWTAAAAAVAACAAIGLGIWAATLSRSLDRERSAKEQQAGVVSILSDPAARRFALSGSHGTLVVSRTGAGALLVSNLRPAPAGKTWEAWVIQGKTPRRAGTFGEAKPFKLTRPVPQGAVVAVTLERRGGVDAPTSKPVTAAQA